VVVRPVVVATIVKAVIVTDFSGCAEGAVKVTADYLLRVFSLNAEDYLYTLMSKDICGSRPHSTRQDYRRALLTKPHRENTTTVFRWRSEETITDITIVLINRVEGECLGTAKMCAEFSFVHGDCDLHIVTPLFNIHIRHSVLVATATSPPPPASAFVNRAGKWRIGGRHHRTLSHHQHALLDQRSCDRRSGLGEDTGERWTGNTHPLGGGFLIEPLEICQANGLELVESQLLDLEGSDRAADGLESPFPGHATDSSEFFRSCHLIPQLRTYAHNLEMSRDKKPPAFAGGH